MNFKRKQCGLTVFNYWIRNRQPLTGPEIFFENPSETLLFGIFTIFNPENRVLLII
jgi:hypothetical protein